MTRRWHYLQQCHVLWGVSMTAGWVCALLWLKTESCVCRSLIQQNRANQGFLFPPPQRTDCRTCLFFFNDVCLQCSDTASRKCKVRHIACNSTELRKFTCKGCRWCLLTEVGLGTVRSRRVPSVQSCFWRATLQENLALALIKHTLTSYSVSLG